MSNKTIIARMHKDGTVVEVLPDGNERPFPELPRRHMTEEEILAAALSDPDAIPMTEEQMKILEDSKRRIGARLQGSRWTNSGVTARREMEEFVGARMRDEA